MSTLAASPSVTSRILVVGIPPSNSTLGVEITEDGEKACGIIQEGRHYVYVVHLPTTHAKKYNEIFRKLRRNHTPFEVIVCGDGEFSDLLDGIRIFRLTPTKSIKDYEKNIQSAMERIQNIQQNQKLLELIHEQNKRLVSLSKSIEERVSKRQTYLQKTHLNIVETNKRGESFQRALIAVHKSNSIGEMEKLLTEAIAAAFQMTWVRIVLGPNQHLMDQMKRDGIQMQIYSTELRLQNEVLGIIRFGRKTNAFSRVEKDVLNQISDSVSLAIARLKILRDTEEIKLQWEATFNSITSPLALVDKDYKVIRANGSFMKFAGNHGHCYELLMNRTSPCENCQLGTKYRIDLSGALGKISILDVTSQRILDRDIYVNIYRDISSQLQIETRIMESAKVAELGTIGSSIAHELNNPLGGIITFIQLIKMDLKGDENYFSDILALESAAQKCKEIIQNLLSFSRASSDDSEIIDLNSVVKRAVQIVELQTRSSEVAVTTELSSENLSIHSNSGMITQALMTFLQLAIESARAQAIRPIKLKLRTQKTREKIVISVLSPKVPASLQGPELLRRTIAEHILFDLNATVEYFAEMEDQTEVKISFFVQSFPSEV